MTDTPSKSIFKSKTIWGIGIVFLISILKKFDINLDEVVNIEAFEEYLTVAGLSLAGFGRTSAKSRIK